MLGESVLSWLYGTAFVFVLAVLALILKRHFRRVSAVQGTDALRILSTLHVGPQQRVVVLQWTRDGVDVRLLLGVTPQGIQLLSKSDVEERVESPLAVPARSSGGQVPDLAAAP